jgi:hypothetical protein
MKSEPGDSVWVRWKGDLLEGELIETINLRAFKVRLETGLEVVVSTIYPNYRTARSDFAEWP